MKQIPGLSIDPNLLNSLGGSPEDAAKAFMREVSIGIPGLLTTAIVSALDEVVGGLGGGDGGRERPDWVRLVRGFTCAMDWEKPPGTPPDSVSAVAVAVPRSAGGGNGLPEGTPVEGDALGGFDIFAGGGFGPGGWQVQGGIRASF